jgi:hypothetical protein
MKRAVWLLASVLAVGGATFTLAQAPADPSADRYIITLKPGEDAATVAAGHGVAADFVYSRVLNGFAARSRPVA